MVVKLIGRYKTYYIHDIYNSVSKLSFLCANKIMYIYIQCSKTVLFFVRNIVSESK